MNRKTFLKSSLALGASCLVLPSGLWGRSSRNSTMQLALVGSGRMGHGNMVTAMNQGWGQPLNARVVACCDVDANRAADRARIAEEFYREKGESSVNISQHSDYRELLARDDIDGLIIATPENWHGLIGVAAANAGKHMYMEKPVTYTIPEGQALVEAVRRNNVVLQTGSQQRSSVYFRQVCSIIRNEWLGPLKRIEVEVPTDEGRADGEPTPPPAGFDYDRWLGPSKELPYIESRVHPQRGYGRPGWLQVERFCLGMITGWGTHMYDIAQWAVGVDANGGPTSIQATGEFPDRGHFDVHVGYEGEAVYENGVVMTSRNGRPGVRFITENGWAYCNRGSMQCSDRELLRRQPTADETQLYHSRNHMGNFLQAAREGKDPACPVEVGHRSNTVCVLHHLSMKLGGRQLTWDPVKEVVVDDDEANAMLRVPMREPYTI